MLTNPTTPTQRLTLTLQETADMLGISPAGVRRRMREGAFGSLDACYIGRRVCIPRARVERYAAGERGGDAQ